MRSPTTWSRSQPIAELVEERFGSGDEGSRLDGWGGLDRRRQLRRSEVGVDGPFDVVVELEAPAGGSVRRRTQSRGESTAVLPPCLRIRTLVITIGRA